MTKWPEKPSVVDLTPNSSTQGEKGVRGPRFSICRYDEWFFYYDAWRGIFLLRIVILVSEAERIVRGEPAIWPSLSPELDYLERVRLRIEQ